MFSLGFCCYCNSQYTRQSPWRRLERRNVDEKSHDPEEEQQDTPRRPSVLAALEEKSDKPEPVKPFRSYYDKDGDAR